MTHEKIRPCPFCNYDEGWVQDRYEDNKPTFYVQCKVCGSRGPVGKNHDMARDLWNGQLSKIDMAEDIDTYLGEEAMGGVSAPMATLNNTPGIGNAVPAATAATTGAQFTSDAVKGSGDKFDNSTADKKKKKKKKSSNIKIQTFDDFISTQK